MRRLALYAVAAATIMVAGAPAHAGLLGLDVDVVYSDPTLGANPVDFGTVTVGSGLEYDHNNLASEASAFGLDIDVTDTQIIITNFLNAPFCSDGTCATIDPFNGFQFIFSGFPAGEQLASVTDHTGSIADPCTVASPCTASDFPVTASLASGTEIDANLTGDSPAIGSQVVLDVALTTGGSGPPPPPVPEPASLMLLGSGLLALAGAKLRRRT
jgi:hypothetical protein